MPKARRKSSKALSKAKETEDQTATVTPCQAASESQSNDARERMLEEMRLVNYDGNHFANSLEVSVLDKLKRGKPPRRNRYLHYCNWAHALLRKEIGPEEAEFAFPPTVLEYIRLLVPGDLKGEIREDAYQVTMEEFCRAMELSACE